MIVYLKDKFEAQSLYLVIRALPPGRGVSITSVAPINTRVIRVCYIPHSRKLFIAFGVRRGNDDVVATFEEFINLLSRAHLEATRGNRLTLERLHNMHGVGL